MSVGVCTLVVMDEQSYVKVLVRFVEHDDAPGAETPWATQLSGSTGAGTFRLENDLVFAPLFAGDVVRCEVDADSRLQVLEVLSTTTCSAALAVVAEDVARAVLLDLAKHAGARLTFQTAGVVTVVSEDDDTLTSLLVEATRRGLVDEWEVVRESGQRPDLSMVDLVRQAEPTVEPHTTTYWAADDPEWAERGLDDPEWYSYIQQLASSDRRVAHALENGRYDQVLTFVERLVKADAGVPLPPLDGPIFTGP